MEPTEELNDEFRDHLSTLDEDGNRKWIFPKMPKGKFYQYRKYVSYLLLLVLFGLPWVKIGGEQLVLFNILELKFVLFGRVFWPQDFHLFFLVVLFGVVGIILFTVVYGRLFCGWVCPQTIFMEMVFRRIEYWIEGDNAAQKRLAKAPWDERKMFKKGLKHVIFIGISFLIANTFLAYIISLDAVKEIISEPIVNHVGGFIGIWIFTLIFYGVFAFFREQVCTNVCPYGRLQGVMLDKDSVVIAYDHKRGEPRGKVKDKDSKNLGDCIDCNLCVQVCPTGIDIRNGTQLECVNCTACIDACDEIMEKVNRPTGLIKYASHDSIENNHGFVWTKKAVAYSVVLFLLGIILSFSLIQRSTLEATLLRTPGKLYFNEKPDTVSNLYNIQIVNKSDKERQITLELNELNGGIRVIGESIHIAPNELYKGILFIDIPQVDIAKRKTNIEVSIIEGNEVIETASSTFFSPK